MRPDRLDIRRGPRSDHRSTAGRSPLRPPQHSPRRSRASPRQQPLPEAWRAPPSCRCGHRRRPRAREPGGRCEHSHSDLWRSIRLIRGARRARTDFFLRAESLFTAATYVDELKELNRDPLVPVGGRSLHEQSHGESFLAVMINRFGPDGFYLLDEPEAALSTQNCLTFLPRVHELVSQGSQFVIATHSPIVLAYPRATIYACNDAGMEQVEFDDADPVRLTQSFLNSRERFLQQLFTDHP
jgi:predicted ATPase